MPDADHTPQTEPSGDLMPPTRHPPTAVGIATPPPPPRQRALPRPRRTGLLATLRAGIDATLDAADAVGDAIREAIGLDRGPGAVVRRGDPDV